MTAWLFFWHYEFYGLRFISKKMLFFISSFSHTKNEPEREREHPEVIYKKSPSNLIASQIQNHIDDEYA